MKSAPALKYRETSPIDYMSVLVELTTGAVVPLADIIRESMLVDVRSKEPFAKSRVEGASNMLLPGMFVRRLAKNGNIDDVLGKNSPILSRRPETTIILYNEKGDSSGNIDIISSKFQDESPGRLVGKVVGGFDAIVSSGEFVIDTTPVSISIFGFEPKPAGMLLAYPPATPAPSAPDFNYISDRLAVGAQTVARDADFLRAHQFTHVLNVSAEGCPVNGGVTCLWISMNDTTTQRLFGLVPDCISFIDTALKTPTNKVLVHCYAGISRSVSIVIIYLMWSERIGLHAANDKVTKRRSKAGPNIGFMGQMSTLDKALKRTNYDITEACRLAEAQIHQTA
jgi:protein-tyrosine phosphatase